MELIYYLSAEICQEKMGEMCDLSAYYIKYVHKQFVLCVLW